MKRTSFFDVMSILTDSLQSQRFDFFDFFLDFFFLSPLRLSFPPVNVPDDLAMVMLFELVVVNDSRHKFATPWFICH